MNPADYPGAEHAVELTECLTSWGMYIRTAEVEGIEKLMERMKESATSAMNSGDPERHEVIRVALTEWGHPNFTRYMIDKLKHERAKL